MSEQQYRVVADRDKGDDPTKSMAREGDLLIFRAGKKGELSILVRIERPLTKDERMRLILDASAMQLEAEERPVPTTENAIPDMDELAQDIRIADGSHSLSAGALSEALVALGWIKHPSPHPPTREQIAEAIRNSDWDSLGNWDVEPERIKNDYRKNADAVLALIQNGADR